MPRYIQFDPTSSFTTPQESSTNEYTKLYLPFDSSVTADGSPENVTVTSNGQASLNTSIKKVGASSLNLDETSGADYLTFPTMALTGDFTIEGFFRTTLAQTGSAPGTRQALFTYSIYNNVFNSFAGLLFWLQGEGSLRLYASSGGNNWNIASNLLFGSITTNSWHHIALTREGSTVRAYFDGTRTINQSMSAFHTSNSNTALGARNTSGDYGFNGQIDDFRILSGLALYTGSSLTVPTSPVTANITTTVNDTRSFASVFGLRSQYKERAAGNWPIAVDTQYTTLYLPFDSNVQDQGPDGRTVTAYGSAAISSTQSKFGGNSLFLNGSSQYLTIPDYSSFEFGNNNFTIESWIWTASTSLMVPICKRDGTWQSGVWTIYLNYPSAGQITFFNWDYSSSNPIFTATISGGFADSAWHHLVIQRSGNTFTLFFDGTSQATTTSSHTFGDASDLIQVGRETYQGARYYYSGYIDDLMILNGYARYSGNFTPPTSASGGGI
tara:strand:+ start:1884 stop:3374 length:1491 start_codon:yes stop_codon:yes gene_type:complete